MSESDESQAADHLVEIVAGDYVFREGDLGTEMFVIHRGSVEILKRLNGGAEEKRLAVFEQGDFFGELSLLDDEPRSASVRALEDTVLVRVDGATFIQMLTENPEIGVRMMRKLSRRLRQTDHLLEKALEASSAPQPEAPPPAEAPPVEVVTSEREAVPEPASEFMLVDKKSGMSFRFSSGPETSIGRGDPVTGIEPNIDLTPIDTQRSSSRKHARIYHRDSRFFIAEEIGVMNGTYVNARRIETGSPVEVHPGDQLRFGTLEFEFKRG